jgi:polysaccharide deacetylase family protein (PEP-CTERM system associated)
VSENVPNALTVDVEEYFHAENLREAYPPEDWDRLESRVEEPLERLLERFRAHAVRATFFVLGWLAERRPSIVPRLLRDGHEVASHGYLHEPLYRLDREALAADLEHAARAIVLPPGRRLRGYRAPSFSITPRTRWALDVLAGAGYEYDSSIFPIRHDRYGDPRAPIVPHRLDVGGRRIIEAPPAVLRVLRRNLPVAGGGYLRLFPWRLCAAGIMRLNASGAPAVVYLHPWDLDPAQPPHLGVPLVRRFRHRVGAGRLLEKLERLLDRFPFTTLEVVLESRGLLAPQTRRAAA